MHSDAQCDPLTYVGCVDDPGDISTYACISIPINQTRTIGELYDPTNPNAPLLEPADAVNIPQRVLINGRIEFDEDYTFAAGSEIVFLSFQSGFDITNAAVLSLNETYVHGCQAVWDGIDLYGAGATLKIEPGSIIEDGNQTIRMRHGTTLSVRDAFFRKNRVCISAQPVPGDPATINVNTFITGTEFDGASPLVQEVVAGIPPNTITYQFPIRAIIANDVAQFNIGIPNANPATGNNTFSGYTQAPAPQAAAAIQTFNTNLTVRNTRIIDPGELMLNDVVFCGIKAGADQNKIRTLDFVGWGRDNAVPTFENIYMGIACTNMNVSLAETNFKTGYTHLSLDLYSLPARFKVFRNRFSGYWEKGIQIAGNVFPTQRFEMESNIFEDNAIVDFGPGGGASIRHGAQAVGFHPSKSNLYILNNEFIDNEKVVGLYGYTGIELNGVSEVSVENNYFYENFNSLQYRGIFLNNSRGSTINENHITGIANFNPDLFQRGIFVSNSPEGVYKCNDLDMIARGIWFEKNCDASDILSNYFHTHTVGLHLTGDARVGPQPYKQNQWPEATSAPRLEAGFNVSISDPDYFVKLANSKFLLNVEENSTYQDRWPIPRSPAGNVWFEYKNEGPWPYLPCYETAPPDKSLTEAEKHIIAGTFPSLDGFDASIWDAALGTYSRLYRFPELRPAGSDAAAYFSAEQNTPAGILATAYERAGEIATPDASLMQTLEDKYEAMRQLLADVVGIDSQLILIPPNQQATQLAARENLVQELATLNTAVDALLSGFAAQRTYDAQNLATTVNAVSVSETFQQNLKTTLAILLEGMQAEPLYEWTSQQSEALEAIAGQCLPQGGFGVLLARTLLPPLEYEDDCIGERSNGHGSSKIPAGLSLQVYPNPAADLLHIRLSLEDPTGQIVLEDQFGRPVLSRRLEGSPWTSLNVARMPSGVYTLRVTGANLVAIVQKIIIQH